MEVDISLNKIAYSIAYSLGKETDFYLREKIKFDAVGIAAMLIRRDLERNPISREMLVSLGCIPLVCVDAGECCDVKTYTNVLRTDRKIPKPIRTKDSDSFYFVGLPDKTKAFMEIPFDLIDYTSEDRYTKDVTKYAYVNQYIYIYNPPSTTFKYINVTSIFADPRQVADFNDCEGACYTDDSPFPLSQDLLPLLEAELLRIYAANRPIEDKEVRINNN